MKQAKGVGQRKKYSVPNKKVPIGDTKYKGRQKRKNTRKRKQKWKGPPLMKKQRGKAVRDKRRNTSSPGGVNRQGN